MQNYTPATAPACCAKPGGLSVICKELQQQDEFLALATQDGGTSSVTNSPGACVSILASRCGGFIVADYASEVKVDGDSALHLAYLYYFLRSDAKTGFRRCGLSAALLLKILSMAARTLGALAIP